MGSTKASKKVVKKKVPTKKVTKRKVAKKTPLTREQARNAIARSR